MKPAGNWKLTEWMPAGSTARGPGIERSASVRAPRPEACGGCGDRSLTSAPVGFTPEVPARPTHLTRDGRCGCLRSCPARMPQVRHATHADHDLLVRVMGTLSTLLEILPGFASPAAARFVWQLD